MSAQPQAINFNIENNTSADVENDLARAIAEVNRIKSRIADREKELAQALAEIESTTTREQEAAARVEFAKAKTQVDSKAAYETKRTQEAVEIATCKEAIIIGASTAKSTIQQGESYQHEGDLTLSCVPKNATILVKNGNLLVKGDVGEGSNIRLQKTLSNKMTISSSSSSHGQHPGPMMFSGSIIGINGDCIASGGSIVTISTGINDAFIDGTSVDNTVYDVTIAGNIQKGSRIHSVGPITCKNIAENCILDANGNIICKNIGASTKLNTHKSSIRAENVGEYAVLFTSNGTITGIDIAQNANLTTSNGSIEARSVGTNASLKTSNASIETTGRVSFGAVLKTSNGRIRVGHVERGVSVSTSNSDIHVNSADEIEGLKTSCGNIYVAGKKLARKEDEDLIVGPGQVFVKNVVVSGIPGRTFRW